MLQKVGTPKPNEIIKSVFILELSCAILSSFKSMTIFNNTSAEIKTKSILLKMIIILKELRIAQLYS